MAESEEAAEARSEHAEAAEPRDATEGMPFGHELHEASGRIRTRVEAGSSFERETEGLAGQLRDAIIDRLDLGQELARNLGDLVERGNSELTVLLREMTDRLRAGLESFAGLLARGADWLRQHGEVFEAGVKIVVLAALAAFEPSLFGTIVTEDPRRVSAPLATLFGGARG